MRRRLRPYPTDVELARLYARPHDHTWWTDHLVRADVTVALAGTLPPCKTVADLSCGNASIARRIAEHLDARLYLGDYALVDPGEQPYPYVGPIEETVVKLARDLGRSAPGRAYPVDLFICCETLEHLDHPDAILGKIRQISEVLLISTPEGEEDDSNPEHMWAWDSEAVEAMLASNNWCTVIHNTLDLRPAGFKYSYGMWVCT